MRLLILSAAFVSFLVPALGCRAEDKPTQMFLLIGQSNMAGRAPLAPEDAEPLPGVLLLNADGAWVPAQQPLNQYASDRKDLNMQQFNLGGPFAQALREHDPDTTVGLIVNARGGTGIELWQPGEDLYEHAVARWRDIGGPTLAGVLWHQGESNRNDADYKDKLITIISALRQTTGQPDLPFIMGHISGETPINSQMDAIAEELPYTAAVTVDGLERFDGTHYDRESMIVLGKCYFDAYLGLVNREEDASEKPAE
ncbi:MAG: sialate O-acetylesterase [Phycisphaerales bacterium]